MSKTPPSPDKIREEISEFLHDKYGSNVAIADIDVNAPHEGTTAYSNKPVLEDIDFKLKPMELEAYLQQ
ncbi:ATPase, partial [bacterium]|nr:ATPase [bacterium]